MLGPFFRPILSNFIKDLLLYGVQRSAQPGKKSSQRKLVKLTLDVSGLHHCASTLEKVYFADFPQRIIFDSIAVLLYICTSNEITMFEIKLYIVAIVQPN